MSFKRLMGELVEDPLAAGLHALHEDHMADTKISLRIPEDLRARVVRQAQKSGMSVNAWCHQALEEAMAEPTEADIELVAVIINRHSRDGTRTLRMRPHRGQAT